MLVTGAPAITIEITCKAMEYVSRARGVKKTIWQKNIGQIWVTHVCIENSSPLYFDWPKPGNAIMWLLWCHRSHSKWYWQHTDRGNRMWRSWVLIADNWCLFNTMMQCFIVQYFRTSEIWSPITLFSSKQSWQWMIIWCFSFKYCTHIYIYDI